MVFSHLNVEVVVVVAAGAIFFISWTFMCLNAGCFCQSDKRQFKLNWSFDGFFFCIFWTMRNDFMFNSKTHVQHKQTLQSHWDREKQRKKNRPKTLTQKQKSKRKTKTKEELNRNLFQGSILVLISAPAIYFDPNTHHVYDTVSTVHAKTNRRSTGDDWWRTI